MFTINPEFFQLALLYFFAYNLNNCYTQDMDDQMGVQQHFYIKQLLEPYEEAGNDYKMRGSHISVSGKGPLYMAFGVLGNHSKDIRIIHEGKVLETIVKIYKAFRSDSKDVIDLLKSIYPVESKDTILEKDVLYLRVHDFSLLKQIPEAEYDTHLEIDPESRLRNLKASYSATLQQSNLSEETRRQIISELEKIDQKLVSGQYIPDSLYAAHLMKYPSISSLAEIIGFQHETYVFLDREYGDASYDIPLPDSSFSLKTLQEWLWEHYHIVLEQGKKKMKHTLFFQKEVPEGLLTKYRELSVLQYMRKEPSVAPPAFFRQSSHFISGQGPIKLALSQMIDHGDSFLVFEGNTFDLFIELRNTYELDNKHFYDFLLSSYQVVVEEQTDSVEVLWLTIADSLKLKPYPPTEYERLMFTDLESELYEQLTWIEEELSKPDLSKRGKKDLLNYRAQVLAQLDAGNYTSDTVFYASMQRVSTLNAFSQHISSYTSIPTLLKSPDDNIPYELTLPDQQLSFEELSKWLNNRYGILLTKGTTTLTRKVFRSWLD